MGDSCSSPRTASSRVSPRRATTYLLLSTIEVVLSGTPIVAIYRRSGIPGATKNPPELGWSHLALPRRRGYVMFWAGARTLLGAAVPLPRFRRDHLSAKRKAT